MNKQHDFKALGKRLAAVGMAAVMLFALVFGTGCVEKIDKWESGYIPGENSFSLSMQASDLDVKLGERIDISIEFRNLTGRYLSVYRETMCMYGIYSWQRPLRPGQQNRDILNVPNHFITNSFSRNLSINFDDDYFANAFGYHMEFYYRYGLTVNAVIINTFSVVFVDSCSSSVFGDNWRYYFEKYNHARVMPKYLNYFTAHFLLYTAPNTSKKHRVLTQISTRFNVICPMESCSL